MINSILSKLNWEPASQLVDNPVHDEVIHLLVDALPDLFKHPRFSLGVVELNSEGNLENHDSLVDHDLFNGSESFFVAGELLLVLDRHHDLAHNLEITDVVFLLPRGTVGEQDVLDCSPLLLDLALDILVHNYKAKLRLLRGNCFALVLELGERKRDRSCEPTTESIAVDGEDHVQAFFQFTI